jgi:hypothetical protein
MGSIVGFIVVCALPGLMLMLSGIAARRSSTTAPRIPTAKIEDGRPVAPSRDHETPSDFRPGTSRIVFGILLAVAGGVAGLYLGAFAELAGMMKFGRPLRVHGRPRRCRRARGTGWHDGTRPSLDRMGAWKRACLGERWLAAARAEHASVPAFRRLGHQLVAAGAPVALVHRCEAAAADEIRHARRCFALARAYSGVDWTAGALSYAEDTAGGSVDLSALAIESLVDGCIGEGIAADLARAGARRATDPVICESLMMIANDEAAHAELAWDVVLFCIERGDADVSRSLAGAARTVHATGSRGPIDLGRSECRRIADARLSSVRERLATLMQVDPAAQF